MRRHVGSPAASLRTQWRVGVLGLAMAATLGAAGPAAAEPLVINANTSDPAPRATWESVVAEFQKDNPDLRVQINVYDHESYKRALRNWLTSASPDVIFWNVGYRMRQFVTPGLLEDVSDLFTPAVRGELHKSAVDLVTENGRQYGAPYSYYHVGLFYRRDLLERAGLAAAPTDWAALLAACDRLKAAGVVPFAIGSKDLWPTAAWFDYLNLRVNGFDFHMALLGGGVPYTDARVRTVFARWRELIDRGCFMEHHASMSWQESQALLYRGTAAMMLIGNFIVPSFPPEVRDRMDFAPFPVVDPSVAPAEDAPMNSLHIPSRAANKTAAKRFLAYVLRADVQERINRELLLIPVNKRAAVAEDRFLEKGAELLGRAEGLAQFFDRDTNEELAALAMRGFQEFMIKPDRLDAVLAGIERARQRIYGP